MDMDAPSRSTNHGQVMVGIVLMAAGLLLLIDRMDLAEIYLTRRTWPLLPLGLGLLQLVDPPSERGGRRSRRSAVWLLGVGAWGLANEFHLYGLGYRNSWPLLIVLAGVNMVWRATGDAPARSEERRS
jgi:hypothetical protein